MFMTIEAHVCRLYFQVTIENLACNKTQIILEKFCYYFIFHIYFLTFSNTSSIFPCNLSFLSSHLFIWSTTIFLLLLASDWCSSNLQVICFDFEGLTISAWNSPSTPYPCVHSFQCTDLMASSFSNSRMNSSVPERHRLSSPLSAFSWCSSACG